MDPDLCLLHAAAGESANVQQWPSEKVFDVLLSLQQDDIAAPEQQLRLGQQLLAPFKSLVSLGVQDGAVLDLVSDTSAPIAIRVVVRPNLHLVWCCGRVILVYTQASRQCHGLAKKLTHLMACTERNGCLH